MRRDQRERSRRSPRGMKHSPMTHPQKKTAAQPWTMMRGSRLLGIMMSGFMAGSCGLGGVGGVGFGGGGWLVDTHTNA